MLTKHQSCVVLSFFLTRNPTWLFEIQNPGIWEEDEGGGMERGQIITLQ